VSVAAAAAPRRYILQATKLRTRTLAIAAMTGMTDDLSARSL
jgi:hypothetical protein